MSQYNPIVPDKYYMDFSEALCKNTPVDMWFPVSGSSNKQIAETKTICYKCSIQQKCLQYSIDHYIQFGIFGGLTAKERRNLKRYGEDSIYRSW